MRAAWSPFWRSRASSASRASRIQSSQILSGRPRKHTQRHKLVADEELRTDEPPRLEPPLLPDADDRSRSTGRAGDPAEQACDVLVGYGSVHRPLDRVECVSAQELRVQAGIDV